MYGRFDGEKFIFTLNQDEVAALEKGQMEPQVLKGAMMFEMARARQEQFRQMAELANLNISVLRNEQKVDNFK